MKLKFSAEPIDILYFILFSLFLFYLVAVGVGNITYLRDYGSLYGFSPAYGLSTTVGANGISNLFGTILFFFIALGGIMVVVSSYFFEREKGFGLIREKKQTGGYSKWAKVNDIKTAIGVKEVYADEPRYNAGGIPLYSDKERIWVDDGEAHTLIIGSTGSGKTYCVVKPLVNILAKHGESMIITDPKGEIYEESAEFLKSRGYKIILLNFRNPQMGNMWNPLALPYKLYKQGNMDKCNELLRDLAINILHEEKTDDAFWQNASADYFVGLVQGLFQDAKEEEININSIIQMITVGEEKYGASTYAKEYFKMKDPSNPAYINAAGTIDAPNETKGSVIAVFRQKINIFAMAENLSEMLSKSDFDMHNIGRQKTAVFLIVQDEKKTYHALATIFIKQCYESLIDVAQTNGGKLRIRTNFILDEFANMPPLNDITTMITAARSRQIRFDLVIQDFSQLNQTYGKENAETIKGNCNNLIYLLSAELNALEEISKLCGDVKIKGKKDKPDETRPLITVSDLQKMKFKDAIIIKQRQSPFKTTLKGVNEYDFRLPKFPKTRYPNREKKAISLFDLKTFVKDKKKEAMNDALMPNNLPFGRTFPEVPQVRNNFGGGETEFDVDELIKKIDAKIAEIEKEEALEAEREAKLATNDEIDSITEKLDKPVIPSNDEKLEKTEILDLTDLDVDYDKEKLNEIVTPSKENTVKVNTNISDIIKEIENEKVSDDEYFDDFFFDE